MAFLEGLHQAFSYVGGHGVDVIVGRRATITAVVSDQLGRVGLGGAFRSSKWVWATGFVPLNITVTAGRVGCLFIVWRSRRSLASR